MRFTTTGTPPAAYRSVARYFPPGCRSQSSGVRSEMSSKSRMSSSMPASRATARRCRTTFVEPPDIAGARAKNVVLHLLAVAREAGVPLDIRDFDDISERTPLLCDLQPGGHYLATHLDDAGGVPVVVNRMQEAGLLHENAITVTGQTIGDHAAEAIEPAGQDVVRTLSDPLKTTGAARSCTATSPRMAPS